MFHYHLYCESTTVLLCLVASGSQRKPDAGTYTVNNTSAPHFLPSGGVNATVPVSTVSLNTSQASEASVEPFLSPSGSVTKPPHHFSQHIPEGHGEEKERRVVHSYQNHRGQVEPGRCCPPSGFSVLQEDLCSLPAATSSKRHFPLNRDLDAS